MSIDDKISKLFGFPVKTDIVLQHLQQDMRDDWYLDVLQFRDMLKEKEYIYKIIETSFGEGQGVYNSSHRTLRPIPKKGFTERYSLETDFFDRFVYQAAISFLVPYIDPKLSNSVLSYRYEKYPLKPKYLFKNKIERWTTFEGLTMTFKEGNKCLVVTDLSNFFETISIDKVCDKLINFIPLINCSAEEKTSIRFAIESLRINLRKWCYNLGTGLPQNRDASSFLSNVALHEVDTKMNNLGYEYFRYVDDIRIICLTESEGRKAISVLLQELRKHGFNLNSSKTRILTAKSHDADLEEIFTSKHNLVSAVNNMWRSRSRRVIMRSTKYICQIVEQCVKKDDTQNRLFRFAVNRLSQLVRAGLVDFEDDVSKLVKDCLINSLYNHAVSTDQYCRILLALDSSGTSCPKIEEYLCDRATCIYDWQNYNLWLFLARHKYSTEKLHTIAKKAIQDEPESGETAAILIWASSVKNSNLISNQLEKYLADQNEGKHWPFINQRYFLIAANILNEDDQSRLQNKQTSRLNYTTSRSKSVLPPSGIPIIDPSPPEISFIIEEANDYD